MEEPVALTPENAHEAAAEAVQSSREKLSIELDYSLESLETLDRLLNDVHVSGRKSREMGGAVILFGCYLGEVLIRKLGGKWVRAEDAGYTAATGFPIVLRLSEDLSCNPLGKVAKRIDNGSEENLPFFFKVLSGDPLGRRSNDRLEASAAEPSPPDLNWPTRPDESGKVAPLLGLMGSSSGPECLQAAYLARATAELTSRGWSPAEFQVVACGPGGPFTIPCVVKRGDEFAMIFSHAGPWAKADYARFKRWYEQVRGCDNTKRTPIIIAHDNDPAGLRKEGMTGDRYGISLEHVEWSPDNVPSREGGEGEPTTSPTPMSGHAGGGRIPPSSPAKPPTAMNQPRSPETETDLSRVNPYAAPRGLVDVDERPTATRATGYAGFWLRFVAVVLDTILLSVVNFGIFFVLGLLTIYVAAEDSTARRVIGAAAYILPILVNLAYFVSMESSSMQATLGKAATGIKVVDLHGRRISLSRSFGRWTGKWLSSIIFMIGYIMAAFTEKKQALHDMMAGTLVVKTR